MSNSKHYIQMRDMADELRDLALYTEEQQGLYDEARQTLIEELGQIDLENINDLAERAVDEIKILQFQLRTADHRVSLQIAEWLREREFRIHGIPASETVSLIKGMEWKKQ